MPTLARRVLVVLFVGALFVPGVAPAAPLPERTPPAGFSSSTAPAEAAR